MSEMIYIKNLLSEFSCFNLSCYIFNDNSAISTCYNGGDHQKNKQYRIKINYIMEELREGWLRIVHCLTDKMIADLLTKPLSSTKLVKLLKAAHVY
jgi:hypothetical protein